MKNKIEDLRNHMFAALEKLSDCSPEELKQELERSRAIAEVGKVIVDSAKVEVDFIKATKGELSTTSFLADTKQLGS